LESLFDLKLLGNVGIQKMANIGLMPFFFIMLTSLFMSLFISHLYLRFYGSKGTGSTLHRAFPLLGVAITAIFVSLQFSIPLSLGLLGALSIVRFRTPIKDPEEVGFILLVIASSLTCATFNLPFLSVIMVVAILGMIILKFDKRFFRKTKKEGLLILKLSRTSYQENGKKVLELINESIKNSKIDSITDEGTECSLSMSFGGMQDTSAIELTGKLGEIDSEIRLNIFYSSPLT
jgi:hypothetical protein